MREIEIGKKYKHFKGKIYKVLHVAYDSESNNDEEPRKLVVYQAEYGDKIIWVREYNMFMSKVDKEKYPEVEQVYRFERI